jgi:hypothetical protein
MRPGIRFLLIGVALALGGLSAYFYHQSTLTDRAYVFKTDLDPYTFIGDANEYLEAVSVPKQRNFEAATAGQILGRYTNQPVRVGQLVQTAVLIDQPPDGHRQFANGLLPINTRAYVISLAGGVSQIFKPDDLVDIIALLKAGDLPSPEDKAVVLFQKVWVLESLGGGGIVVALTYEQIAAYEGWTRVPGITFTAAISQPANGDYPGLHNVLMYPDYNDPAVQAMFAVPTPTPAPAE